MTSLKHVYRVALQVPHEHADAFVAAIEPHCDSVAWTARQGLIKSEVTGFVDVSPIKENLNLAISITAKAKGILAPEIKIFRIPIRNWVVENLRQFPPVRIGRFFIFDRNFDGTIPTWAIPLKVPAGAAFGTGRHGSTQGCLMALDSLKKRSIKSALDMGCGSGILALAISKRWRCQVVAFDIDTTAVRMAKENSAINGETRFVNVLQGPGYCTRFFRHRKFDLIVSNIVARPLVKMSSKLSRCLALGGTAILSGLLTSQEAQILVAHRVHGLKLKQRIRIDGWSTLVLCKDA